MLPQTYELPAAVALILGGTLCCFAGYRLFRLVLGIYGFILGAMIATSVMGAASTMTLVGAAVAGGLVGALVLMFAYVVGIALIGAGIAALIAHVIWSSLRIGDPPALAVIIVSIGGAIGAMLVQRYVIIVGTAFGGAWTLIIGSVNALATRGVARGASLSEVWILYPTSAGEQRWTPIAWILLGLVGTGVQLSLTAGRKKR